MKLSKATTLLISGLFLTFLSLSDLDNFSILLHGFFLLIGLTAIVMSVIVHVKSRNEADN
jgi:hypothetical protein